MTYPKINNAISSVNVDKPYILIELIQKNELFKNDPLFDNKNNILSFSYYVNNMTLVVQDDSLLSDSEKLYLESLNTKLLRDENCKIIFGDNIIQMPNDILINFTESINKTYIKYICEKFINEGIYLNLEFIVTAVIDNTNHIIEGINTDLCSFIYTIKLNNMRLTECNCHIDINNIAKSYYTSKFSWYSIEIFKNIQEIIKDKEDEEYNEEDEKSNDNNIENNELVFIDIYDNKYTNLLFRKIYNRIYSFAIDPHCRNHFLINCKICSLYVNSYKVDKSKGYQSFYNYCKENVNSVSQFLKSIELTNDKLTAVFSMNNIDNKNLFNHLYNYLNIIIKGYSNDSIISFEIFSQAKSNSIKIKCDLSSIFVYCINNTIKDIYITCNIKSILNNSVEEE